MIEAVMRRVFGRITAVFGSEQTHFQKAAQCPASNMDCYENQAFA